MNSFPLPILAATFLVVGCGAKDSPPVPSTNAPAPATASANPLDAPGQYLKTVVGSQQTAIKTIDTTAIQQAIQMFQIDKGRYPKDLKELVDEKFMPRIPEAPTGMKIDYNAQDGTVKVVKQ